MMFGECSRAPYRATPSLKIRRTKRRQLERHAVVDRQLVEQAHVLDHEVHGEVDVAAAVQYHLRFRLVHERVAGRDANALVGRVHVEAQHLRRGQRLGERHEVRRAEVVGQHLQHRRRAELAGVQDLVAEHRQHREGALEGRARAAREDRDVAGCGAVAAARYRAFERRRALLPRPGPPGAGSRPRRSCSSRARPCRDRGPRAGRPVLRRLRRRLRARAGR